MKSLAIAVEEYFTLYPKELDDQFSPLQIAGTLGIISLCDHIIERTGEINPARKKDGKTPLHSTAARGNLKIVKYLAEQLEDKNPARNDGVTPLFIAAQQGHLEIVKYIAGYLENKNPSAENGDTPLSLAQNAGQFEVANFLNMVIPND